MNWKNLYKQELAEESNFSEPVVYTPLAREHFRNPRNVGEIEKPDGRGAFGDPTCGDYIEVTIRVNEQENRLTEVKFLLRGCAGAISTSSMMTELAAGKTFEEALAITDDDVIQGLGGLPKRKRHCSLLGLQALQQAIGDYLLKRLLLRDGVVKTEEEYEQLKAKNPIIFQAHSCDGSCEEKEP
jgi:nitrogen fixation NifU-like protein